ncbi:putative dienelactone hydrolase, alpha/Beta hydrolase [Helianthus debilis subsp. tardiflorus]
MKGLKTHVYGLNHTKIPRVPKCNQLTFNRSFPNNICWVNPEAVRIMSGPECCQNPPAISSGGESGELLQIGSLNSYVSGNPDSKVAVLLVSDVFGYEAPKLRQLADKVAAAGYYVVVPDFFHGDPLTSITKIGDWLKNHAPEQAVEFAKPVIQTLKEKGITKIGAAGFCWGAKVVVELAKDGEIQFAALLHPSFVTVDDIKGVKVPTGILGAEIDKMSPPELVKEFEAALVANEVNNFAKIYPGVSHGWTIRYKDEDAAEVKCAEEAHQDLVEWFGKCL